MAELQGIELYIELSRGGASEGRQNVLDFDYPSFVSSILRIEFPTGKVGEPYRFEINLAPDGFDLLSADGFDLKRSSGFEELGLRCRINDSSLLIEGTPTRTFKGRVEFYGYEESSLGRSGEFSIYRPISIASVPFEALEKHDPPKDGLYADIPYDCSDGFFLDGDQSLSVLAASKRGRLREHLGAYCKSGYACALGADEDGWHVFAAAEGCESAKYAHKGADLRRGAWTRGLESRLNDPSCQISDAVENALLEAYELGGAAVFPERVERKTLRGQVDSLFSKLARKEAEIIAAEAQARKSDPDDYRASLQCVAIKRFSGNRKRPDVWAVLSYGTGDGVTAIYRPNDAARVVLLTPLGDENLRDDASWEIKKESAPWKTVRHRARITFLTEFGGIFLATKSLLAPFVPPESFADEYALWEQFLTKTFPSLAPGAFDLGLSCEERAEAALKGLEFQIPGYYGDRAFVAIVNDALMRERSDADDEPDDSITPSDLVDEEDEENDDDLTPLFSALSPPPRAVEKSDAKPAVSLSRYRAKFKITLLAQFLDPNNGFIQFNRFLKRIEEMSFDEGETAVRYDFTFPLADKTVGGADFALLDAVGFKQYGFRCEIDGGKLRIRSVDRAGKSRPWFKGQISINVVAHIYSELSGTSFITALPPEEAGLVPVQTTTRLSRIPIAPKPFIISKSAGEEEEPEQGQAAVEETVSRRLPVYILLDTSGSMRGEPIEAVKVGLQSLLSSLRRDPYALETVWLSIISYDLHARVLTPLTELSKITLPSLSVPQTSPTNLGEALALLIERLRKEVRLSTASVRGDWNPILVVMTDGAPSDTLLFKRAANAIKKYPFARIAACCAGPRAKVEPLRLLTDEIYSLGTMDVASFAKFWDWVSSFVSRDSMQAAAPPDDSELPPPPAEIRIVR